MNANMGNMAPQKLINDHNLPKIESLGFIWVDFQIIIYLYFIQ